MRLKLDENIGRPGFELLSSEGHDVSTVRDQGLEGATDETLFDVCAQERRTLVTLDHDFGQVFRFPPELSAGIVILEPGPASTFSAITARLRAFWSAHALGHRPAHFGSLKLLAFAFIFVRTAARGTSEGKQFE